MCASLYVEIKLNESNRWRKKKPITVATILAAVVAAAAAAAIALIKMYRKVFRAKRGKVWPISFDILAGIL